MISPILSSIINGEYTFVIIGDCSKLGWKTSENFEKYREEWIAQNKEIVEDIAEEMYAGCDDGTDIALKRFKEAFGEKNVKFVKDTGGTISEYEVD